jgi:hypothetical protein
MCQHWDLSWSSLHFEQIFAENLYMLNELSDNFFLQHVFKASDTDSDHIQAIECHFMNTVPQQTITLLVKDYLSVKVNNCAAESCTDNKSRLH